jgi:hypothetical protein
MYSFPEGCGSRAKSSVPVALGKETNALSRLYFAESGGQYYLTRLVFPIDRR